MRSLRALRFTQMDEPTPSANRQIARAAGTVMFAIVLSQITGLVRGILVARAFPAAELDAFFAANRVSETLFMLLAAGALGSAFIPTFTGFLAKDDKVSAWKLASSIANLLIADTESDRCPGCHFRSTDRKVCAGSRPRK